MSSSPLSAPTVSAETASRCPIDHGAAAISGCPVAHRTPDQLSRADRIARRVLRVDANPGQTTKAAYAAFQKSMMISATRCTLTYVIFPFVLPAVGFATGVGPWVGLIIGIVAIVCDVFAIRRFFAVHHKYRWYFTAVASGIIGLLFVLLVQDILHLVT